jgi:hypothetical protein
MVKLSEVQKSARNFSYGLDLSQRMQKRHHFNWYE